MSLSRPAWPAGPAWPVPPADTSPRSKRPRLEEPACGRVAAWPPLVVPRLSEVEKVWEWPPRPFTAFLVPQNPGNSDTGGQRCDLGWQDRTFQTRSSWQSGTSGAAGCSWAPGRSPEPGLRGRHAVGVCRGDTAEVSHAPPKTSGLHVQRVKREPEELPVRGKESTLKEKNSVRQPANPFLDVTFSEETKPALHDIKDRRKADSVITSEKKENNTSSSSLKIPKIQNQACLESAKPSYFRDNITIISPEFPRDLNSNMSFVYLKEIAKKKNDKIKAYVRDFTNIFWSQNRPDAKKQKLQDDKRNVFVENDFPHYESHHQSLTVEGKIDSISLNYDHHSSIKYVVRYAEKNFTLILEDADWEGTERNLDCDILIRQESPNSDYSRSILKRKRQNCWIIKNFRIICEAMKKLGENSNLAQLLETDLLNKGYNHSVKVRNVHEQQSKTLTLGTLGMLPNLIKVVWFSGKDENTKILQLRYYTAQKYISGNKGSSTLTCHQMLTCERKISIQKSGILSKFLQRSFDSFIRNGDYWESELECIFKCIVHLDCLKNIIKESHIEELTRMFISSRPLENNTKSMAKKRKLVKIEHILEGAKRHNISSLSVATKSFPMYKPHKHVPLLMDFDDMEGLSLTKEPSYENRSCPEQLLNVENLAYYSFSTASTGVKSDTLFIQSNCGHKSETYYKSGMYNQDLDIERKQKHKTPHFKFIFEDVFNVQQLGALLRQTTIHSDQRNAMAITQKLSLENLLGKIGWKKYDFIVKKDVKVLGSPSSCQVHKVINTEKEEDSSPPGGRVSSVQLVSRVHKNGNVGETKSANQNKGANTKEDGVVQESELAHSKHFSPENDSTLYADHQFESDSSGENNGCFQGLTAKCLPTETLPTAKDFEMKSKFDLVLEELRMFHEISKEDEIPSIPESNIRKENYYGESNDVKEARIEREKDLETVEINKRKEPSLLCDMEAGPNQHKRHQGLFTWKTILTHGGQVVPNEYCVRSEEELSHSTPEEDYKKSFPKSLAFSPDECKKENYNYLLKGGSHFSNGISRVQPLKTCSRPIRVGLSRRARLKQLHPYLK